MTQGVFQGVQHRGCETDRYGGIDGALFGDQRSGLDILSQTLEKPCTLGGGHVWGHDAKLFPSQPGDHVGGAEMVGDYRCHMA